MLNSMNTTSHPAPPFKRARRDRIQSRRPPVRCVAYATLLCGVLLAAAPIRAQAAPTAPAEPSPTIAASPSEAVLPLPQQAQPQATWKLDLKKPWKREQIVRFYVTARPFFVAFREQVIYFLPGEPRPVQIYGGGVFNVGFDYQSRRNFWLGLEFAPLLINNLIEPGPRPIFNARLTLGYAGEKLAIGGTVGGGLGRVDDFVHVGFNLRLGRLRGTHIRLRLETSVYVVTPYPVSGDLEINVRLSSPRARLYLNVGGDSAVGGLYSAIGAQYLVHGDGGPGSDILVFGVGLIALASLDFIPGPLFTVGYERRW